MQRHILILKKAHQLLSVPGVHTTGTSEDKNGKLDLARAIFKATTLVEGGELGKGTAIGAVYQVLRSNGYTGSIFTFNDLYKLEDILKVLKIASEGENHEK